MTRQIFSFLFISFMFFLLCPLAGVANSLNVSLEDLSGKLVSQISNYERPVVIVTDFHSLNGDVCDLGRYISKKLSQNLSSIDEFIIMERSTLDSFGPKLHLNPTSSENIQLVRDNLGANLLVLGDFVVLSSSVEISIRLFDIDKNKVIYTLPGFSSKEPDIEELATRNCQFKVPSKNESSNVTFEPSPGDWREKEKHGLGFGYWLRSHLFYDYNMNPAIQLHFGFTSISLDRQDVFNRQVLSTSGSYLTSEVRYFPEPDSGWFIGGGSGYGSISQSYAYDSLYGVDTDSTSSFIPVFLVGGWQGWDGYYFTINLSIGTSIVLDEEDNTNNIPDYSNHRFTGKEDFETMKNPTSLGILFGWYL